MSSLLVTLQLGLLILQAVLAANQVLHGGAVAVGAWIAALTSLALAAWTLRHNRLGNFNIRPLPKASGNLVTSGPYRWIRHPMYSSLLLGAAALAGVSEPVFGWLTWSALALVLFTKSTLEERWKGEKHPGYAAYVKQSKRFLPWLF
ncbi:MAG: isoprenylcysteine carboxylmethyltransferase family protein [Rhodoferax sp.]|nr:isoprenylcysteine carboxylmethyltransferase family protein [Rhodoferax sp.]